MSSINGVVPNLVLAGRVIHKMVSAARIYTEDETGEALVGVVVPGEGGDVPTLYVLDTIPPDETDVVREYYTFQQGDERQYEIFTWLNENWQSYRARVRQPENALDPKWDVPLLHIGDWHKQPGYMIAPSHGDLMSALDQIDEQVEEGENDFLLVPILTHGHPSTTRGGLGVNYHCVPDDDGETFARIDFWYIDARTRAFMPISPVVTPDEQMPPAFPLHWHITDEARASLEIGQMEYEGYLVSPPLAWDTDDALPLEVCLIAARAGERHLWIIATPHDFPAHAPRLYKAPLVKMGGDDDWYDVFEQAWANAQPISDPQGWEWSETTYLIDYLNAVHPTDSPTSAPSAPTPTDGGQTA